jgi:hypothetical protein
VVGAEVDEPVAKVAALDSATGLHVQRVQVCLGEHPLRAQLVESSGSAERGAEALLEVRPRCALGGFMLTECASTNESAGRKQRAAEETTAEETAHARARKKRTARCWQNRSKLQCFQL